VTVGPLANLASPGRKEDDVTDEEILELPAKEFRARMIALATTDPERANELRIRRRRMRNARYIAEGEARERALQQKRDWWARVGRVQRTQQLTQRHQELLLQYGLAPPPKKRPASRRRETEPARRSKSRQDKP
jgi:bZIP Maf transcription factor